MIAHQQKHGLRNYELFFQNCIFFSVRPKRRKTWPTTKKKISQFKTDPEDKVMVTADKDPKTITKNISQDLNFRK